MSEFTNETSPHQNYNPESVEIKPTEQIWSRESRIKLVTELGMEIEDWLKDNLPAYVGDKEMLSYRLGYAINEALINAVAYGNLQWKLPEGVTKMKQGERSKSIEALEEARPDLAKKLVVVKITIGDGFLVAVVKDEGKGFDLTGVPDPLHKENMLSQTGRGLEFARKFFSKIETKKTENGFEVILTKDLSEYKKIDSKI